MSNQKHQNYFTSSILILGSATLGIISFMFVSGITFDTKNILNASFTTVFIIGLGLLIRTGKNWVKYLLLGFTILGLILMYSIGKILTHNLLLGIISIVQTIMQILAVILLFRIPKKSTSNE